MALFQRTMSIRNALRRLVARPNSNSEVNLNRRKLSTSFTRLSQDFQQEGIPGSNMPFSVKCKYKLAGLFVLFFSSGLTAPFILVRRHLLAVNMEPVDPGVQETGQTVCFSTDGSSGPNTISNVIDDEELEEEEEEGGEEEEEEEDEEEDTDDRRYGRCR